MTTTLVYSNIQLGFSPQLAAADSTGEATQEDIAQWITDGDITVKIRTGTTTESDERNLLIKEFVMARYLQHCKNWLAKGGQRLNGLINADLSVDPWINFRQLIKDFNDTDYAETFIADGTTYSEE